MEFWGITDKGAVRKQNQDAYQAGLPGDRLGLAVVCDGMGGALAGNVASTLALQVFWEEMTAQIARREARLSPERMLREALACCNERVYRRSQEDEDCRGMGTTLVAVLSDGTRAWVANVGDSRCYLADGESIRQVSRDHSLVEALVLRGEITPEQARRHPNKNLITRALGVDPEVAPDIFEVDCPKNGYFLLCSDGLSNQVTNQELLYEILHGGPPETCCQRLLEIALNRGAPDNVTTVLMKL